MSLTHMTMNERNARIASLDSIIQKEARTLLALEEVFTAFGDLTEAQHNTFANAQHKHDEAAAALSKMGVFCVSWEVFSKMHDK